MPYHFVNMHQTSQERRLKYALLRFLGRHPPQAHAERDHRWSTIARYNGFKSIDYLVDAIENFSQREEVLTYAKCCRERTWNDNE